MSISKKSSQKILTFWFGENSSNQMENQKMWFEKNPNTDKKIKELFYDYLTSFKEEDYLHFKGTPQEGLSLVILVDQFSRNIFRDSGEAFQRDSWALGLTKIGIEEGWDKELSLVERWFFYLPLMHSESLGDQDLSLEVYRELSELSPESEKATFENVYSYAIGHRDIIKRFGRYPHRNKVLERVSTKEEEEFLAQPGSSF